MGVVRKGTARITLGGEESDGWLPPGAAVPPRTPTRELEVDVALEDDGAGYLLSWASTSAGKQDATGVIAGDLWFESLDDACAAARDRFGLAW